MNKLKLTIWIFALANMIVALAGMWLGLIFENIFSRTLEGGLANMPPLSQLYLLREKWCFAVFTVPLLIAALINSRRSITNERGSHAFWSHHHPDDSPADIRCSCGRRKTLDHSIHTFHRLTI
jgi:hypothetical protein